MWYNTTGPSKENKKGGRGSPQKNQRAVSQSIDNKGTNALAQSTGSVRPGS